MRVIDVIKRPDGLYTVGERIEAKDFPVFAMREDDIPTINTALTSCREWSKHTGFLIGIVSHLVLREIAELESIRVFKDGNVWCATAFDFVNIQDSPAWFNNTYGGAINDLLNGMM